MHFFLHCHTFPTGYTTSTCSFGDRSMSPLKEQWWKFCILQYHAKCLQKLDYLPEKKEMQKVKAVNWETLVIKWKITVKNWIYFRTNNFLAA